MNAPAMELQLEPIFGPHLVIPYLFRSEYGMKSLSQVVCAGKGADQSPDLRDRHEDIAERRCVPTQTLSDHKGYYYGR